LVVDTGSVSRLMAVSRYDLKENRLGMAGGTAGCGGRLG
jgi:hypothetical protein